MIPEDHHIARLVNRQDWFDCEHNMLNEQAFMRNRKREPSISVLHYELTSLAEIFNISDNYIYPNPKKGCFGLGKIAVSDVHKCSKYTKIKPSPSKYITCHCDVETDLEDQVLAAYLAEVAIWVPRVSK